VCTNMLSALVLLTVCSAAIRSSDANTVEIFDQIQELLRVRRSVLGENDYLCYEESGECVAEYKMDGLVTYKEEARCSRSEQGCGCGTLVLERAKREELCVNMNDDLELCKRSADQLCGGQVVKKMEEMECVSLLEKRRARMKRDQCVGLQKRFSVYCGGRRKRAISEECAMVMEEMDSQLCGGELELLEKRALDCPAGWSGRRGVCYKYFNDPKPWGEASKTCKEVLGAESKYQSQLATIESMLVQTAEDRDFFTNLIKSSGAIDHIDAVLSTMNDHFGGKDWKESITYYDNWSWIGVKKTGEEDAESWKWAVKNKNQDEWNKIKVGHADWSKKEPSHNNEVNADNGKCVVYFYNTGDGAMAQDVEKFGQVKAWWNANCKLELPFLCEYVP